MNACGIPLLANDSANSIIAAIVMDIIEILVPAQIKATLGCQHPSVHFHIFPAMQQWFVSHGAL